MSSQWSLRIATGAAMSPMSWDAPISGLEIGASSELNPTVSLIPVILRQREWWNRFLVSTRLSLSAPKMELYWLPFDMWYVQAKLLNRLQRTTESQLLKLRWLPWMLRPWQQHRLPTAFREPTDWRPSSPMSITSRRTQILCPALDAPRSEHTANLALLTKIILETQIYRVLLKMRVTEKRKTISLLDTLFALGVEFLS